MASASAEALQRVDRSKKTKAEYRTMSTTTRSWSTRPSSRPVSNARTRRTTERREARRHGSRWQAGTGGRAVVRCAWAGGTCACAGPVRGLCAPMATNNQVT
eukprot:scaffold10856_cov100-Isochrysis_galbana.AAC.8